MSLNSTCLLFGRMLCSIMYWVATSSSKTSSAGSKSMGAGGALEYQPMVINQSSTVFTGKHCQSLSITDSDFTVNKEITWPFDMHAIQPLGTRFWMNMSVKWTLNCISGSLSMRTYFYILHIIAHYKRAYLNIHKLYRCPDKEM